MGAFAPSLAHAIRTLQSDARPPTYTDPPLALTASPSTVELGVEDAISASLETVSDEAAGAGVG